MSKSGQISFEAFDRFYRVLRFRPEIAHVFAQLSKTNPSTLTYEEFRQFAKDTQRVIQPLSTVFQRFVVFTRMTGVKIDVVKFMPSMPHLRTELWIWITSQHI